MQPPVAVPAKGGPLMLALVTRPDGANVTVTLAVPDGSPDFLHDEACEAADESAEAAAARSNGPTGPVGFGGLVDDGLVVAGAGAGLSCTDVGLEGSAARGAEGGGEGEANDGAAGFAAGAAGSGVADAGSAGSGGASGAGAAAVGASATGASAGGVSAWRARGSGGGG